MCTGVPTDLHRHLGGHHVRRDLQNQLSTVVEGDCCIEAAEHPERHEAWGIDEELYRQRVEQHRDVIRVALEEGQRGDESVVLCRRFEDELLEARILADVGELVDSGGEVHHFRERFDGRAVERREFDAVGHGEHVRSFWSKRTVDLYYIIFS